MSQQKEALFSKKNRKLISDPLNDNNPVTTQVLGICSALAITVQLKPAIVMALSVLVVLSVANVVVSLMRKLVMLCLASGKNIQTNILVFTAF